MSDENPNAHLVAKSGFFTGLHPGMGIASKAMIAAFVIFTVLNVEFAGNIYKSVRSWIENGLSWYYISVLAGIMLFCFFLMFSKFGSLRLGDDDSRPEFSNFSWFAMLFSAGIGIGILFFGVAEPIFYFDNSGAFGYPNNPHAELNGHSEMDMQRAIDAMRVTYFHWGLHGWALYVIVGLSLAYFGFRKKLPLTMRSSLYPLIGERIYGPWGHCVDLLAVFGAVFGIATSLGLGSSQIATGLNVLFGIEATLTSKVVLIIIVIIIATASTVSGVGKGIRIISEMEYLAVHTASGRLCDHRPDQMASGVLCHHFGRLHLEFHSDGVLDGKHGRKRCMARWLDHLLLGLVDCMGTACRYVYRAYFAWANDPGIHGGRSVCSNRHCILLALHVWRQRHLAGVEYGSWSGD